MKYTAAVGHNNIQGREYSSVSPKFASATYSEGFSNQYNSPKTAGPAKGFIIPKTNNENLVATFSKQQKNNSFIGQGKSKATRGPVLLVGNEAQTPKTLLTTSVNNQTLGGKGNTPKKGENLRTVSSTPKNASSYRPSDATKAREDASYSGNFKWKKLEISTDYNNSKASYGSKAQTTKHTEADENAMSQSAVKSLQPKNTNTPAYNLYASSVTYDGRGKEKEDSLKPRSNRPLSSSDAKGKNTPTKEGAKVNNFFGSERENSASKNSIKKEKTTSSASKLGQTLSSGFDDDNSQPNGANKKPINKTQVDLRTSWHNSGDSVRKKERPSSAKKPSKDSREETVEKASPKDTQTPTQRVSLQMFVTSVNKGDAFGGKKYGEKRDNSTRKTPQKPYLSIDDKSSKPDAKSSKTTSNIESKAYAVSLGKHVTQTPMSSSQILGRGKASTTPNSRSGTQSAKDQVKSSQEIAALAKAQGKEPFIYYMTSFERAHKFTGEPDYFIQVYREHFLQSFQALSFCKVVKPADPHVLSQKRVNLTRRESAKDKKTLIFDMDETLIHCNESPDMPCDVILPIVFPNGEVVEAGINVRPYALEILKELSQFYEIVVFTASHACYANVVLDYIDPGEQYIHHRLFRDSCVVTEEGVHIKDLRVIGNRNMQDLILVDNAAYSFGFQIENGIPIIPFYDNKADQELRHLIPYLKFLSSVKDLREINKQTFKLQMFADYDSPETLLERLFA